MMGSRGLLAFGLAAIVAACGDSEGPGSSQNAGGPSATGASSAGGASSTNLGGAQASGGIASLSGGQASPSGGRPGTGGSVSSFGGFENTNTGGKSPLAGASGEANGGIGAASAGRAGGTGGAQDPSECPELQAPSPDPDDGGELAGALSIVLGNEEQLGTYSTISGNLTIGPSSPPSGARIEDIDLTHLRVVEGDLMIRNTGLGELELPRLERVTGQLWVSQNYGVTQVRMPQLTHVGALYLDANLELVESEFPRLETVDTTLYIHRNLKLMSWGLDALQTVGSVMITANPALPQCVVDSLNENTGQMASSEATGLEDPPICDCQAACGRISVACN